MSWIRGAIAGLVVAAACTGCATVAPSGASYGDGSASPDLRDTAPQCENGWYDHAAGVCDTVGD